MIEYDIIVELVLINLKTKTILNKLKYVKIDTYISN